MHFETLLKKISPTLKRIVFRLKGGCGHLGTEDLYQEALLHLWQDFKAGKLEDKTDSYILQGCFFHLKNYLRTHRNKAALVNVEHCVDEDGQPTKASIYLIDKSSLFLRDNLNSKLLAETIMNNGLTTREKLLLSFCAEGLTTRQLGRKLGVSHVSVVKMLRRIKEKCLKYTDHSCLT